MSRPSSVWSLVLAFSPHCNVSCGIQKTSGSASDLLHRHRYKVLYVLMHLFPPCCRARELLKRVTGAVVAKHSASS